MALPRVLIINDQPRNGSPVPFPDKAPYRLCSAETLAQGLAQFDMFRPEVVVLDLNLPDGPGMDAFRALRSRGPRCPVLLLAADAAVDMAQEAMKEGAFDCLVKPADPIRLGELIGRALETVQAGTEVVSPLEVEAAAPALGSELKLLIAYLQKDGDANLYARMLSAMDRVVLTEVLRQTRGNQLWASEILGIDRKTLRQKLRNLDMLPIKPAPAPKQPVHCNGNGAAAGSENGWQEGETETE